MTDPATVARRRLRSRVGPAALAVAVLDLGIGWLWASLGLLMATRTVTLGARFAGGR